MDDVPQEHSESEEEKNMFIENSTEDPNYEFEETLDQSEEHEEEPLLDDDENGEERKKKELGEACHHLTHPFRLLICGRSGQGKTTLAVQLMLNYVFSHVRRCFAVCPTFYIQEQLRPLREVKDAFPPNHVFVDATDEVFDTIYSMLNDKKYKDSHGKNYPSVLYVDDAGAERATHRGAKGAFARLCIQAPHLNLSVVGVFQQMTMAATGLRNNCDDLIMFRPKCTQDIKHITEEFNPAPSHPKSAQLVRRMLDFAWDQARFLYIHCEKVSGHLHFFSGFHTWLQIGDASNK